MNLIAETGYPRPNALKKSLNKSRSESVLKGRGFEGYGKSLCFERARLQPRRKMPESWGL